MRIRDIHIDGFGCFEDFSLHSLRPGINLIVGENEAGKSTLMKFIRYTLFGYPRLLEKRMAPIRGGNHGGRIVVEANGGVFVLDRRSGANGGAVEVTAEGGTDVVPIRSVVGTATSELFENVYAFSLEELVGMESLKESGVEDRIFSIGLGLGGKSISGIGSAIDSRADDIYKPGGNRHVLNTVYKKIEKLQDEISGIQEGLPKHKQLSEDIENLETLIKSEEEEIADSRKDSGELDQLISSHESYARIVTAQEELDDLPKSEGFSEDLETKYDQLINRKKDLLEEIEELQNGTEEKRGIRRLGELVKQIECNDTLLSQNEKADYLNDNLVAYKNLIKDRTETDANVEQLTAKIAREMSKISAEWTEDDLQEFTEETSHINRLDEFRVKFENANQKRANLEQRLQKRSEETVAFPVRPVLVIIAVALAIASVPFFYYSAPVVGGAVAGIALIVFIGSFFAGRRQKPADEEDWLANFERTEFEPLKTDYKEYMAKELKLSPELTVAQAVEAVKEASRLKDRQNDRAVLERKIEETLRPEIAKFEKAVDGLAQVANVSADGDAAETARRIVQAFRSEKKQAESRAKYKSDLADLEMRVQGLLVTVSDITEEIKALFVQVGVEDEDCFRKRLANERRVKELEDGIASARTVIAGIAGPKKVDEVLVKLAGRDKADLDAEAAELKSATDDKERSVGEFRTELGAKKNAIEAIEGETEMLDLLNDKAVCINRLQTSYEQWLAHKVSLRLLSEVKEEFEREKQPAVIQNTVRYFGSITRGAYERVSVSLEDKSVSVFDERDAAKTIDQLSRGTKEQLLISLRLGFIEEYEQESEPLPVIVDDIFVNFDDRRSHEAARVFWEFANGKNADRQILIFTCHPRTKDFFDDREVNWIDIER